MNQIKKVIVIHKTHLDIGFTDTAMNVLDRYVNEFIPKAIDTAYECNQNGQKNFIWTTGSFLIRYYLEHAASADTNRLKQAIQDGYITWHGLACTTHTELMDKSLFQYDLQIAKKLDLMFGKHTVAAKMTDVPCHTHTIVPYLVQNGISYLHIGINSSSRPLQIPNLCRLQYGTDEVILNYDATYGAATIFGDYALEFAHTADNMGPPSPERVFSEMQRIRAKYPNAEVIAGTMDDFAQLLLPHKKELPIINYELGDTWIHGIASDPWKSAALKELLEIRNLWIADEPEAALGKSYDAFMLRLLLVCEHTWGIDSKLFPADYQNWNKKDFYKVRSSDNFSIAETSWREQRQYIADAVNFLPSFWKNKAISHLAALKPTHCTYSGQLCPSEITINGYYLKIYPNGSVQVLQKPNGRRCSELLLGTLFYNIYSAQTVNNCYNNYNRNIDKTHEWSWPDFGKPGLEKISDLKDTSWQYTLHHSEQFDSELILFLNVAPEASTHYGAPRHIKITYRFEDTITITLQWFDKDASRIPEAIFFGFHLGFDDPQKLRITKLGLPVNPFLICDGGNKKLHAVTALQYEDISIHNLHAPLLSIGGMHLYDTEDVYPSLKDGIYYVLFNNRWGTNFPLWYEENASFVFKLNL